MTALIQTVVYGIFDSTTGKPVFNFDTYVSFKFDSKMKVSDFPVEKGAFATYNKVRHPYEVKVRLAISQTEEARTAFLYEVDKVMKSIQLMSLVTPDGVYDDMTLTEYTYDKGPSGGWGRVVVDLHFLEVRQVNLDYGKAFFSKAVGFMPTDKYKIANPDVVVNLSETAATGSYLRGLGGGGGTTATARLANAVAKTGTKVKTGTTPSGVPAH